MNFLRRLALQEKKLDDSSRLDFVEIARVPDILPRLFPSWSGGRAKDLTAPQYFKSLLAHLTSVNNSTLPVNYESSTWQKKKPEKELMPSAWPLRYEGDSASHADWRMSDRSFNKQSIHLFNPLT